MKKFLIAALIAVAVLIAGVAGLYAMGGENGFAIASTPTPEPTPEPTATPEPTPTPTPVPPVVVCVPAGYESFAESVRSATGRDVVTCGFGDTETLANASAVAAVVTDRQQAAALSIVNAPLAVYDREGSAAALPENAVTVSYSALGAKNAAEALENALNYPPHDTPVRLLGVFEDSEGEAANTWRSLVVGGKILTKGTYGLSEKSDPYTTWIFEMFSKYWPGMVDAVFCETPELAVTFAEQMIAKERDDFEIFTIGSNEELRQLAEEHPRILPITVEYDDELAEKTTAALAAKLLEEGTAVSLVIGADGEVTEKAVALPAEEPALPVEEPVPEAADEEAAEDAEDAEDAEEEPTEDETPEGEEAV